MAKQQEATRISCYLRRCKHLKLREVRDCLFHVSTLTSLCCTTSRPSLRPEIERVPTDHVSWRIPSPPSCDRTISSRGILQCVSHAVEYMQDI